MKNEILKKGNRIVYLDFLRAIALIPVIMLHVEGDNLFPNDVNFVEIKSLLFSWGVPIYLMITGALFLTYSKQCDYKRIWRHIKYILLVIVFWGMLYNLISKTIIEGFSISVIVDSMRMVIVGDTQFCYQFWYLYTLIPIYIILPIVFEFFKRCSKKEYLMILILSLLFTIVIPNIASIVDLELIHSTAKSFSIFSNFLCYVLLGGYISNFGIKKLTMIIMSICTFLMTVLFCLDLFKVIDMNLSSLAGNKTIYSLFAAILIFGLAKNKSNYHILFQKIFMFVAKYSFGVYIIHVIVIQMMRKLFGFDTSFAPVYFSAFVIMFVSLLISLFGSFVMKKIPVLRKLV